MKLLYCIAGTCHSGGMERVLTNKANYLTNHGYEVVIVTTDQQGKSPFFPLDERIRCIDLGINYEENNGKSFANKLFHYPFKQYLHKKRLTAVLKQEKPDITLSMFCNDAEFITHIHDGSKKILEIHFSKFKRLQYGRKGLWRWADLWRSRQDENAKKVIAIGRYTYQKGFERLIEAWRMISPQFPEWKLDIIGDGEERETLQCLIYHYGLEKTITLFKPMKEIAQAYCGASLLVLTSRYEGLPMVLLEAQTFGLPIVAFQCKCGPKDIVEEGKTGFLVEEGNIREFAQKMALVMSDEELRKQMGRNAQTASLRYKEDSIMEKWMKLFDVLVKK